MYIYALCMLCLYVKGTVNFWHGKYEILSINKISGKSHNVYTNCVCVKKKEPRIHDKPIKSNNGQGVPLPAYPFPFDHPNFHHNTYTLAM